MQRVPIETRFLAATEGTFCTRIFQPNEHRDEYWRKFVNLIIHSLVREKNSCSFGFRPNYLDPPPPPNLDNLYHFFWTPMCQKIWAGVSPSLPIPKLTQYIQFVKSGQKIWAGPSPPLNWTKSKRTATFFGRPSPREPSVLIISSHPIFCARFLNHWTIMHAILFLIFSAAQFWTLSDVWRWATENFTTFGNWKRATEIARKFKKMSNGEFCNFGALKKSCGD